MVPIISGERELLFWPRIRFFFGSNFSPFFSFRLLSDAIVSFLNRRLISRGAPAAPDFEARSAFEFWFKRIAFREGFDFRPSLLSESILRLLKSCPVDDVNFLDFEGNSCVFDKSWSLFVLERLLALRAPILWVDC